MFRVEEFFLIEQERAWAVALRSSRPDGVLTTGEVLVAGQRRWKVAELHAAPAGLLGAKLEGPEPITRGLVLRSASEPMGDAEYQAGAIFLVRIARACSRAVDLDGVVTYLAARRAAGQAQATDVPIAKTAILVSHLAERGASSAELDAAAAALGLKEEV